jgi:LacI family transcriptional regulator
MRKKIRNVLLILSLSNSSGREYLTGISQIARQRYHWNIRLLLPTDEAVAEMLANAHAEGVDGIICHEMRNPKGVQTLLNDSIPLVVIGGREPIMAPRAKNIAFVQADEEAVGKFVADRFFGSGNYASFAFVPFGQDFYWSDEREKAFCAAVAAHGLTATVFQAKHPTGSREDIDTLGKWLKGLPKPAAVMAAFDSRAMQVMEAAARFSIPIPRQISVIGVDNDELICDFTEPPLTSISADRTLLGEKAAVELEKLIRHPTSSKPAIFHMGKIKVIERDSDLPTAPATHLIKTAQSFIENNATRDISVDDVVAQLGVSRRLADLRCQQIEGKTIAKMILDCRMKKLLRLLKTTKSPIKKVTASCGFADEFHVKRLFKKTYGVSMRDYRKNPLSIKQASGISKADLR